MKWWKAAGNRAIRTIVQSAVASIGTAAVMSQVDWKYTVSSAILAGILSMLTSLLGLPEVELSKEIEGLEEGSSEETTE